MKRMRHPLHGFHHCYNGNEEASMRANGWVDDAPDDDVEIVDSSRESLIASAQAAGVKVDKRWSDARLAAEIEKA
jgi:hypothetical protein